MLLSLWKYVKGCVRISVRGFSRERFLNLLAANDIFAWDIVNRRSQIVLTLTVSGFKRIRPILKKTNCRFKIISRGGLPFIVHKYRRRTVFACGFAIFFLLVFYMAQFIWLIDINGNSALSDAEILHYMESRGIYTGVYKRSININTLKDELRAKFPQIAWISITQNGTRLYIDISENIKNTEVLNYSVPCDIISNRDCIIADIVAQSGTPLVKAGDAVKKGDVLISSAFEVLDENGSPAPLVPVHSTGSVRGRWQEEYVFAIPYTHTEKTYTGKTECLYSVTVFGKNFNTNFIKNGTKFKKYDKIDRNIQLGFSPDFPLPIVINKTLFAEYGEQESRYTPEQAQKRAESAAAKKLLNDYPKTVEIIEKRLEYTQKENELEARLYLTLEDEIGAEAQR